MNVLFVTYGLPYPPDSGARIRDLTFIRYAAQQHNVSLMSLLFSEEQAQYIPFLEPYCDRVDSVVIGRGASRSARVIQAWHGLRAGRPAVAGLFEYDAMVAGIRAVLAERTVDVIQFEHSFLAPCVDGLPDDHGCKTVLDFHNIAVTQYRRIARLESTPGKKVWALLKWMALLRWEKRYARRFDRCLVVSELDASYLRSAGSEIPVTVVENGVDTAALRLLPPPDTGNGLILVGFMAYPPNRDASLHFARDILPLVRKHVPDASLCVVGRDPPCALDELELRDAITVTGQVADVVPYYQQSRVALVPLRAGGGTRLKILEAMALGRPVVSTPVGCEGLEVRHGEHLLVADQPEEFAEQVVRLLTDRELSDGITRRARQLVTEKYDWTVICQKLTAVYDGVTS